MFNHYQDLRDLSAQRQAEWVQVIQEQWEREQSIQEQRKNRGAPLQRRSKLLPSNWFNRIKGNQSENKNQSAKMNQSANINQSSNKQEGNSRCPKTLPNP